MPDTSAYYGQYDARVREAVMRAYRSAPGCRVRMEGAGLKPEYNNRTMAGDRSSVCNN